MELEKNLQESEKNSQSSTGSQSTGSQSIYSESVTSGSSNDFEESNSADSVDAGYSGSENELEDGNDEMSNSSGNIQERSVTPSSSQSRTTEKKKKTSSFGHTIPKITLKEIIDSCVEKNEETACLVSSVGGLNEERNANETGTSGLESYHYQKNMWIPGMEIPYSRQWYSTASLDRKIFVFGGTCISNGDDYNQKCHGDNSPFLCYDLELEEWDFIQPNFTFDVNGEKYKDVNLLQFTHCAMSSQYGLIYFMGGQYGPNIRDGCKNLHIDSMFPSKVNPSSAKNTWKAQNFAFCYNPKKNTISELPSMPSKRHGFALLPYKGRFYCVGGSDIENYPRIDCYDILSGKWIKNQLPIMKLPKFRTAAAIANDFLYVIGGQSKYKKPNIVDGVVCKTSRHMYKINLDLGHRAKWIQCEPLPKKKHFETNESIHVIGNYIMLGTKSRILCYDIKNKQWKEVSPRRKVKSYGSPVTFNVYKTDYLENFEGMKKVNEIQ